MEAVRTSETSVYYKETTRRNIPESYHLHTHRRENLQSRTVTVLSHTLFLHILMYVSFLLRAKFNMDDRTNLSVIIQSTTGLEAYFTSRKVNGIFLIILYEQ
jgi:hypothetical protein